MNTLKTLTRLINNSRGIAVAEVLMGATIGGLILSVLPAFYLAQVKIWTTETGRLGAIERADFAVRRLEEEVRNGRSIVQSENGYAVAVTLPKQTYDADLGTKVNALDANGQLIDGDRINYYFLPDQSGSSTSGGSIYRRVDPSGGTQGQPRLIVAHVYPHLNPRGEGGTSPQPLFAYDSGLRTLTATITIAEPMPSTGTFVAHRLEAKCRHDGGDLVRVPTPEHLEGEIQCSICGNRVKPTCQIATHMTKLMLRNR